MHLPGPRSRQSRYYSQCHVCYYFAIWRISKNFLRSRPRSGLSLFSPPPLPSSSQASPTPEPHQASPEPSSTPEPSCRQGVPTFNNIRGKWCCSVCDRDFRGKWECTRHIEGTGNKQVKCVACGGKLKAREDSLRRHLRKYCKGDLTNIQFEDAFVEL